jgi:hypothetical protein
LGYFVGPRAGARSVIATFSPETASRCLEVLAQTRTACFFDPEPPRVHRRLDCLSPLSFPGISSDRRRLRTLRAGRLGSARAAGDVDVLRVFISQLRTKIEADPPSSPTIITTDPGIGYRWGFARGRIDRPATVLPRAPKTISRASRIGLGGLQMVCSGPFRPRDLQVCGARWVIGPPQPSEATTCGFAEPQIVNPRWVIRLQKCRRGADPSTPLLTSTFAFVARAGFEPATSGL